MSKPKAKARAVSPPKVRWYDHPEEHDYPAAGAYLSLVESPGRVVQLLDLLRAAPTTTQKAKDILRAARLPQLPTANPHVASDLAKIAAGQRLSPILLVRGHLVSGAPLQIADGYHRVCASYYTDENTDIPCRLVSADPPDPADPAGQTPSPESPEPH